MKPAAAADAALAVIMAAGNEIADGDVKQLDVHCDNL